MDVLARLRVVETENEELRERIARLEAELWGLAPMPVELRLTGKEEKVLGCLMQRPEASRDAIMLALYGNAPSGDDEPEIKIVDVFVFNVRKKLKPFGIEIGTHWGHGYFLDAKAKAAIRAMQRTT